MTAYSTDAVGRARFVRDDRLMAAAAACDVARPTLLMDRQIVAENFRALQAGLGRAQIHYAVKANPDPAIIRTLLKEGSGFDAASRGEIELCLSCGVRPEQISFGNTIKRASDIAFAHSVGITLFAADAEEELEKIAAHAPGSRVYLRLIAGSEDADWPLTRKFGCGPDQLPGLLKLAKDLGLEAVGLSFHVGSQTRDPAMWADTLSEIAQSWHRARAAGFALSMLNIGGGFPAAYGDDILDPTAYGAAVMGQIEPLFGQVPIILAEPGRSLVADAGVIVAEVLLVSRKSDNDLHRWVYLDIGRFSGLAETEGEAIRYPFVTSRDHEDHGPCILAGPSCDSVDILYERRPVSLPLGLRGGDRVLIRNCGAYTSSYASVGFNGFPPLDVVMI